MMIELWGGGFRNKGAELMLLAAIEQFRSWDTGHAVAAHLRVGSFRQRKSAGIHHRAWIESYRFAKTALVASSLLEALPSPLRVTFGLISEKEVDAVLDLSGFAFSDQWGPGNTARMAWLCKRWKSQGKKIIFLPQAFGPFHSVETQGDIKTILREADLVFARDKLSLGHLLAVDKSLDKIRIAPDFTNLLEGETPDYADLIEERVALVPNVRMVDKTPPQEAKNYLKMLEIVARKVLQSGRRPLILVHEEGDVSLARELRGRLPGNVRVVNEKNPLKIKGLIKQFDFVVSSRFHALVSSLSQGIPAIGTGWSHKYQILLEEYGCSNCLLRATSSEEEIIAVLNNFFEPSILLDLKKTIAASALQQKQLVQRMWDEVKEILEQ